MLKKRALYIIPAILFLQVIIPAAGGIEDNFTGSGSKTTATFTSENYTKITWSYTPENAYDLFYAYIYEQGETYYEDSFTGGSQSETVTYLYASGTFYFDVTVANIASWSISTQDTTGEYASATETFTGTDSRNTKLFSSYGDTEITWTTTPANEFDMFGVYIYELGADLWDDTFEGESGTTHLYSTGDFYFDVSTANLLSWSITINAVGGSSSTTTTTTTTTTSSGTTSSGSTTDAFSPGFEWFTAVIASITAIVTVKKRKSR